MSRKTSSDLRKVLLAGAIITPVLAACASKSQSSSTRTAPEPVATARVESGDIPVAQTGLGQVQAFNTAVARAEVSGQIVKIQFTEGQQVARGAPIAQIDPRPLQATLAQDEANTARDQASLTNAQAVLDRYTGVASKGLVTDQQVDAQRSQTAQLRATVAADQAVSRRDHIQLEFASVRAPISGVTGLRLIDIGNLVGPTDPQGLVTISQIQPIAVLFTLPQTALPAIRAAMTSTGGAGLEVDALGQGGTDKPIDVGRLALINNQVDQTSGTITLKAIFPNAQRLLWPGESVQARLILRRQAGGLTVPSSVVQRGVEGAGAWVVAADGTVALRPIQVGGTIGDRTVIEGGLKAGEEVVTDGQFALTPGAHVVRVARKAAAVPGSAPATPASRTPAPQTSAPMKNTAQDSLGLTP
ncbi:MAG: efflux RND transporter periplasmic adaptor subunit [Caulobacteraceae bacterium]